MPLAPRPIRLANHLTMSELKLHLTNLKPDEKKFVESAVTMITDPKFEGYFELARAGRVTLTISHEGNLVAIDPQNNQYQNN